MELSDIYQKASLVQIPSGYKSGTLYSVVPNTSSGDFTVTGDPQGEATRVNKDGLIESVAADVPRLNYDLTNPQNPHLLLEPTRTNSLTYSEDFSQWGVVRGTISSVTSPTGSNTAALYTKTENSNEGYVRRSFTVSSVGTYSVSVFLKYNNTQYAHFLIWDESANGVRCYFDIENGTIGSANSFGSTFTATDLIMENYGNGWYRCSAKVTVTGSDTGWQFYVSPSGGDNSPITNTGAKFNFFGAQVEQGSYPTSYIPTTTAQVTRTADTCSLPNYANLPTDYPLTVYWKGQVKEFNGFNCAFSVYKDGASGEFLTVSFNTSSQILVRRAVGGSEDVDFISYSYSIGDVLKIGIKFTSATTFKLFINGLEIYEETSGASKTWDFNSVLIGQLRILADVGNRNPCNELMIFNEALTDQELIQLTT